MQYQTAAQSRAKIGDVGVFCAYDELAELSALRPNPKNPNRHPEKQIQALAKIIASAGWRAVITVSRRSGMIVRGHGRYEAAHLLGLDRVPVEYQEYATEAEELADMVADNTLQELSELDNAAVDEIAALIVPQVPLELMGLEPLEVAQADMSSSGGSDSAIAADEEFAAALAEAAATYGEDSDEYRKFLEKFEPKRTTDDCYTPPAVFSAVRDWVCETYNIDPGSIVRPFYPGGDYENFDYPENCLVCDNPPFSILAKILDFYLSRNIRFFLFAPTLTAFSGKRSAMKCTHLICDVNVVYENGAVVNTSFITNLGGNVVACSAPELRKKVTDAVELSKPDKSKPKYSYPSHVVTASMLGKYAKYGIVFSFDREDCCSISRLDSMSDSKVEIFGGGFLISDKKAAERAAAERAAAVVWNLSDREQAIISGLGRAPADTEDSRVQ